MYFVWCLQTHTATGAVSVLTVSSVYPGTFPPHSLKWTHEDLTAALQYLKGAYKKEGDKTF